MYTHVQPIKFALVNGDDGEQVKVSHTQFKVSRRCPAHTEVHTLLPVEVFAERLEELRGLYYEAVCLPRVWLTADGRVAGGH